MGVPDRYRRWVMPAAARTLARRLALPYTSDMQDWAWEVADSSRLNEFLAAYDDPGLDDDQRFALMEVILQSFEDLAGDPTSDRRWAGAVRRVAERIAVHASSVWYWSGIGHGSRPGQWRISAELRRVAAQHPEVFGPLGEAGAAEQTAGLPRP